MAKSSLSRRIWIVEAILVASVVLFHAVTTRGARVPAHRPLKELPLVLGRWVGGELPIEQRIIGAVGVDDYLSRTYTDKASRIDVYIGYYEGQRPGVVIHSPKNCLPGTGWEPVRARRLTLDMPNASPIEVNEYLVEKGTERQLVLYWYQARGRVISSEYWGRVWLVVDSLESNRTDGALIRVSTPTRDGEELARQRAAEFVRLIYPRLGGFIPG